MPQSPAVLGTIMRAAARNNVVAEITGILLVGEGTYLQILEGDPFRIARTYERIRLDARHMHVQCLHFDRARQRNFKGHPLGLARRDGTGAQLSPEHAAPVIRLARRILDAGPDAPEAAVKSLLDFVVWCENAWAKAA